MIITCKQVAKRLAEKKLHKMSWLERVWIKLHIKYCLVCGEYHRNVEDFQLVEDKFSETEHKHSCGSLACQKKAELKSMLKECSTKK